MKTILDFTSVFLLRILLPYLHLTVKDSRDSLMWKLEIYQTSNRGVLHVNLPYIDKKLWFFEVYCPEEWDKWLCLDSPSWQTPRQILSNASLTTESQIVRMKLINFDRPFPAYFDLSNQSINMVISAYFSPNQKILNEIGEKIVDELDKLL